MKESRSIVPVILSGGSGQRLWPLSRTNHAKQLLPLAGVRTLIQDTALRFRDEVFAPPVVVCNEEHRFIIAEQLMEAGIESPMLVLEPEGRNTAPAAGVAAMIVRERDPSALMLVLPADHMMTQPEKFLEAVLQGAPLAREGKLVIFGILPSFPETGFGYIEPGADISGDGKVFSVSRFVEKPDAQKAARLIEKGCLWNSGAFLFSPEVFLAELGQHEPGIPDAVEKALAGSVRDLDFLRLGHDAFCVCKSISIDHAVMERTDRAAVIPVDPGWTDVGSWNALWEIGAKDACGNVAVGDVIAQDVHDSYLRSEKPLLTVAGLDHVVVVATEDAILVTDRRKTQAVKELVAGIQKAGRREAHVHRKVWRPWGNFQSLHDGDRFQVKSIIAKPGAKLSKQKHYHRAEHWIVVHGTALVTRGEEKFLLHENESVYLPAGIVHRLENPGKIPLQVIEVQSGSYLGEDDIERLEDHYGRMQ